MATPKVMVHQTGCKKSPTRVSAKTSVSTRRAGHIYRFSPTRRGSVTVRAAEDDKKETLGNLDALLGETKEEKKEEEALYVDDIDDSGVTNTMSDEQKKKLRDEYLGFGGSPDEPIPNYFLYIILVISALAVASALTGAI